MAMLASVNIDVCCSVCLCVYFCLSAHAAATIPESQELYLDQYDLHPWDFISLVVFCPYIVDTEGCVKTKK